MSSTKPPGQQCTANRKRDIVNTIAKKQASRINITTKPTINTTTQNLARHTLQSHGTSERTIKYHPNTFDARLKPSRVDSGPSARIPLLPRDRNQNARPLTTSRPPSCVSSSSLSSNPLRSIKMPIGGGGERPRQPQLAAKPLRPPLTPKVASKSSHSQPVTPLGRRAPNQTPTVSSLSTNKDEAASPLASFLNHNITPRSGSRQSRVESTNTTPSGTPVPERQSDESTLDDPKLTGLGVSMPTLEGGRSSTHGSGVNEAGESKKFFYASDARVGQGPVATTRPNTTPLNKSPPTFFYANGTTANKPQPQNPAQPAYSSPRAAASDPNLSKFFYANGTPDVTPKGNVPPSRSGSTVSGASRVPYTRPITSNSTVPPSIPPLTSRPASPIKAASTPTTHTLRHNTTSPMPPLAAPSLAPPSLATAPRSIGFRRDSLESSSQRTSRGHSRAESIPTIETIAGTRLTQSPTSPGSTSPLPSPALIQPALTMATIMQAVDALGEEDESKTSDIPSEMQSPTKSVNNDPISELVMNARRERKVQDLEITNASLEAINRTLERQLRKQTAELRRYRRLSRSGRLSLASVTSSRVTSGASTIQGGLPDLSEEEFSDDDQESLDDEDLSSSESMSMDDPLSPDGRVLARRKRDEKRLQLDLSKHQELLVDSQKINQSLKRCLDWTEVLIKEGKKALEYHVRVSDVEIGGRVLAPEDDDDEDAASHLYQEREPVAE